MSNGKESVATRSVTTISLELVSIPDCPLTPIFLTIAAILELKCQQTEVTIITALQQLVPIVLQKANLKSFWFVKQLQQQVSIAVEEKSETVPANAQEKEELSKLKLILNELNIWVNKHQFRGATHSTTENVFEEGNRMSNVFLLLGHLLKFNRCPNPLIFLSIEPIVSDLLNGFAMVDQGVLQKFCDLREELTLLSTCLHKAKTVSGRVSQSIGTSIELVATWLSDKGSSGDQMYPSSTCTQL